MAVYVYKSSTGELNSWCPNDTDQVAPANVLTENGLTSVSGLPPLDNSHEWDPNSRSVVTASPTAQPNWLATYQFILLFTAVEHAAIKAAIKASTDNIVQQFMMAVLVAQRINLNDPIVQRAVGYLASVGLLTQANAALILSGQASQ